MKKLIFLLIFIMNLYSNSYSAETGNIEGKVLNMRDEPMAKVKVILDNNTIIETNKEGYFLFQNVPLGKHSLTFEEDTKGWIFPETPVLLKKTSLPIIVKGELHWWAYILIGYIVFVVLLMTIIANFLVFLDFYVMPHPTRVFYILGIIIGLSSIVLCIIKLGDPYLNITLNLLTFFSLAILIRNGLGHSKKTVEKVRREKEESKLKESEKKDELRDLIGKEGLAVTDFSLIGKAEIEQKIYEARSRKDFIKRGQEVCVLDVEGGKLIIEKGSYNKYQ